MFRYLIVVFFLCTPFIYSCSPMGAIVSTTSAGAVVAESNRTVGEAVDDTGIKIKIAEKFARSKTGIFLDIDVSVRVGTVLLTGIVDDQETRIEAVKLVWEVNGVEEVINEIEIGNKQNLEQYTKDLWITTQVKAKTLNEVGLDVLTYNFETINFKVYVMGVAIDKEETEKIIKAIKSVKGVKEIANHIILRE